jgi:putative transposase
VESDQIRTAVCLISLTGPDYRRAHEACHQAALLWNQAVKWVHGEWKAGRAPDKYDIRSFLTSLPQDKRPLHTHSTEAIAYDLYEAIRTFRANRKNGMRLRAPWRKKNYRPLSFTKGYGWRISKGKLHLSLGRGRPRIDLPIPAFSDSATAKPVPSELWGEIQLCWDKDARCWSLHISYETERECSSGQNVTAIDEGIINSMALASWVDDKTIDVTVVNGREARAIKRQRNKSIGSIQRKLSRCKHGSRKHRRLVAAKKKIKARAKRQLRDFNHQVSCKAANHVIAHNTGRLVVGDVRGIEQKTRQRRSANRHQRQRLSQWERGKQERYLMEKVGLEIEYLDESDSTKTCPACGTRNRPSGRDYRCKACSFACHRDAVGAINILQKALYGSYVPIGADTKIRVTYLRAVERWSKGQRKAHSHVQRRKARAPSSAQNRATPARECKPKQANPSTSSFELGRLVVVA